MLDNWGSILKKCHTSNLAVYITSNTNTPLCLCTKVGAYSLEKNLTTRS